MPELLLIFAEALNSHFKLGKCLALSRYASPHASDLSLFRFMLALANLLLEGLTLDFIRIWQLFFSRGEFLFQKKKMT